MCEKRSSPTFVTNVIIKQILATVWHEILAGVYVGEGGETLTVC